IYGRRRGSRDSLPAGSRRRISVPNRIAQTSRPGTLRPERAQARLIRAGEAQVWSWHHHIQKGSLQQLVAGRETSTGQVDGDHFVVRDGRQLEADISARFLEA